MTLCDLIRNTRNLAGGIALGSMALAGGCFFDTSALTVDGGAHDAQTDVMLSEAGPDSCYDSMPYDGGIDGYDASPDEGTDGGIPDAIQSDAIALDAIVSDAGPNVDDYRHPYGCDSSTVALYHLNSPAPMKDSCGANDAIDNGTSSVAGKDAEFGQARSFDGAASYLSVPHSSALNFGGAGDFTVEAWFRPTANPDDGDTIVGKLSSNLMGYRITYWSGVNGWACQYWDGGGYSAVGAPGALNDGSWHHVACVRSANGTTASQYIDGALAASETIPPRNVDSIAPLTIGNTHYGLGYNLQWFKGDVDEVRVSGKARP